MSLMKHMNRVLTGHLWGCIVRLRKGIGGSVKAFNTAAGSWKTRVTLVSTRKFKKDWEPPGREPIETAGR